MTPEAGHQPPQRAYLKRTFLGLTSHNIMKTLYFIIVIQNN